MKEFKRVFVVDGSSVSDYCFIQNYKVCDSDVVFIVVPPVRPQLDIVDLGALVQSKCDIQFLRIESNKSVNYQLLCVLGALCGKFHKTLSHCHVVSDSKTFLEIDENFCRLFVNITFSLINPKTLTEHFIYEPETEDFVKPSIIGCEYVNNEKVNPGFYEFADFSYNNRVDFVTRDLHECIMSLYKELSDLNLDALLITSLFVKSSNYADFINSLVLITDDSEKYKLISSCVSRHVKGKIDLFDFNPMKEVFKGKGRYNGYYVVLSEGHQLVLE